MKIYVPKMCNALKEKTLPAAADINNQALLSFTSIERMKTITKCLDNKCLRAGFRLCPLVARFHNSCHTSR